MEVLGAEENSDEPDDKDDKDDKDDSDDKGDSDDREEEFDWYIQQEAPLEGEEEVVGLNTIRDHGYGFGFSQVGNDSFCAIYKCVEHSLRLLLVEIER